MSSGFDDQPLVFLTYDVYYCLVTQILTENTRGFDLGRLLNAFGRSKDPKEPVPLAHNGMHALIELRKFLRDPKSYLFTKEAEIGPIFKMNFLGSQSVILLGPDANELVFVNREQAFMNQPAWEEQIGRYFRGGLLLRDGAEHRAHRLMMNFAFTDVALRSYVEDMQRVIKRRLDRFPTGDHPPFLLYNEIKQMTLEVASEVFLGERDVALVRKLNKAFLDIVQASGPGNINPFAIPGTLTHRGDVGRQLLEDYIDARIEKKRDSDDRDFFALLARGETRKADRFNNEELVDHLIFLMMAAHDTSTMTASTLFYYLAKNLAYQEKCRDEVFALGNGPIEYDDLDKLPLIEYGMQEALRLMPPLPYTTRRAVKDVEFEGKRIRAGENVMIAPLHTHFMPSLWTDPERFDPLRFSPERAEHKRHRFGYVPFGGGVHKCIGMRFAELEVRTLVAHALQRYRFYVPEGYELPLNFTSLPIPADGLPIRIERVKG